jgi:hypothetical protein
VHTPRGISSLTIFGGPRHVGKFGCQVVVRHVGGLIKVMGICLPMAELVGDIRALSGRTLVVPVAWDGTNARILHGHRPASLHGAALADALAAIPPGWSRARPVPLVLTR